MTPEQYRQLQEAIREQINAGLEHGIEYHVNGKIKALTIKLDNYIKNDEEWKQSVTPSIEVMRQVEGFSKTTMFLLKFVGLIGGALTVAWAFIKYLKT